MITDRCRRAGQERGYGLDSQVREDAGAVAAEAREQANGPAPGAPSILPMTATDLKFEVDGRALIDCGSFSLADGARTVVLGPNGAGKSLLLRLCHGLLSPTSGRIDWAGMRPQAAREYQAMVFQRPVLLRRSVAANISYVLSVKAVPRHLRPQCLADALELAGLTEFAGRPARVLSGGEQQRLAIARAWAVRPQVLLLDEPTSNLDPATTAAVESLIQAVHRAGTKVIMTTHDLGQAQRIADEVFFLHQGRLLERAPVDTFFGSPSDPVAAAYLDGRLPL